MRLGIIAMGSRGDVQPYVALGKALVQAGHKVRFMTHGNFAELIKPQGMEFCEMVGDVQKIAESPEVSALLEKGDFIGITRHTAKAAKEAATVWAQTGLEASQDLELLIVGVGGLFSGLAISEKTKIPILQAFVFPFTPTRTFPGILFPDNFAKMGAGFNLFTHTLVQQAIWQGARAGDTAARKEVLGLAAAPFFGPYNSPILKQLPTVYGFSPVVVPKPKDWHNTIVAGYWTLQQDKDWKPSKDLENFLNAGKPPVYIGFGSMSSRDPKETTDLVLAALAKTKERAILSSGWGGLNATELPENIFSVQSVPHAWLFPRMAAIVHHGGAGTTAAALTAGVPNVVIPFFADQPYWGRRVAALGAGPAPIERKKLTSENLAAAIETCVGNTNMRQAAAKIGKLIQNENGVQAVVELIDKISKG